VARKHEVSSAQLKRLLQEARKGLKHAVPTPSGYRVGAALRTSSGKIFRGSNIVNPSYMLTLCAERVALYKALSEGERRFSHIAVVASGSKTPFPCGACRQILWEFAPQLQVVISNDKKGHLHAWGLKDLLPHAFEV
jgi:cytidine deaminase